MSRPGLTNERLTALFILAAVLFTPPFLGIFNSPVRILGVPALYLYLFITWGILIAVVAAVVERSDTTADLSASEVVEPRPDAGPAAQAD